MDSELVDKIALRVYIHHMDFPGFCIADAYKLIYQGCMGPEHAILDPEAARTWLEKEWDSVEASTHEGLYTDATIHTRVHRINIRAAKAFDIPLEKILADFIDLAETFPKRPDLLRDMWAEISRQIENGRDLVCDPEGLEEFNSMLEENDYPAVHHSAEYKEENKPAYRLVNEIIPDALSSE